MRQNEYIVNNTFSSIIFCRQHEILLCITKVVNEKLWQTCRQQKGLNHFGKRIDEIYVSVNSKRYQPSFGQPRDKLSKSLTEYLQICTENIDLSMKNM